MPFDRTLWQAVILTGGLLPIVLLFIEWVYFFGSPRAITVRLQAKSLLPLAEPSVPPCLPSWVLHPSPLHPSPH